MEEKEYKEVARTKEIKKTASKLGFSLILGFILSALGSLVAEPFSTTVSLICIAIPAFILFKKEEEEIINFKPPKNKSSLDFIMFGLLVSILGAFLSAIIKFILNSMHINFYAPTFKPDKGFLNTLFFFFNISVIPAITEEFIFRGVILGKLRKYGETFAVLFSSITFSLLHGNLEQIPFAFVLGLALGLIVIKTGSILPSMILHFLNNFRSCIIIVTQENYPGFLNIVAFFLGSLSTILGIISWVRLKNKNPEFLKLQDKNSAKHDLKTAFLSAGIILFSLMMLIIVATFFTFDK